MRLVTSIAVVSIALSAAAHAQDDPPPGDQQAADRQKLHWGIRLGVRSLQIEMAFPVVDRVVLVPDAATYVDELGQWSPQGRWPVLIEDDVFAPMFIRRFRPDEVIVRESVGELPEARDERQARLERVVVSTWGGDPQTDSVRDAFTAQGYVPPGVVIASVDDPAWTAAVALAAGRGQPLCWLDDPFGSPDAALDAERAATLKGAVDELVRSLEYPFEEIGDVIDTITICRSIAGRVHVELPAEQRVPAPENYRDGPIAMTDVIGRNDDWTRYAFAGWIFGDETAGAYRAMCSLFLTPASADLINSYSGEDMWAVYGTEVAATRLAEIGFEATERTDGASSLDGWHRMIARGLDADVLLLNSSGNPGDFKLRSGRARAVDVPLHHRPVIAHVTHSWSMQRPTRPDTIAGRWLDHGAYAYVGSMHEPLLNAFVPPSTLVERTNGLVPLLVAARVWESDGVFSRPWRVNTFGDPLMLCASPERMARDRLQVSDDDGEPLLDRARSMMQTLRTDSSPAAYAETVRRLTLLGRDDLSEQVWKLAVYQEMAGPAAPHMLDVFFRLGRADEFRFAWSRTAEPTERQRDMAWHMLGPELDAAAEKETLRLLASAIRRTMPHVDAGRLAPHFDRAFGRAPTREMLQAARDSAIFPRAAEAIEKLLGAYPEQ